MKIRKNASGFTLAELVLAVAILTILLGLATVNVIRYLRTLTQLERDGIAREIFVAAQNHLTMAESQGFLGVSDSGVPYEGSDNIFYYLVANDSSEDDDGKSPELLGEETAQSLSMLNVMLPFASVDETVLRGGSYVIRYQRKPALVLEVFYAAQSGRFKYTFTNEDFPLSDEQESVWDYSGSGEKENRKHYKPDTDDAVIGWYGADGGATPDLKPGKRLNPPLITVDNAERLSVTIKNPNVDLEHSETFKKARLHLEINGETSGKQRSIELISDNGFPVNSAYILPDKDKDGVLVVSGFTVYLDDVTGENTRFHKVMGKDSGFYPGENITIRAVSYNNDELTNIAASAPVRTNSLYASWNETTQTAEIANFRHLENLDLSHISSSSDFTNVPVTVAKQVSDMNWTDFCTFFGGGISVHANNNVKSKSDCYLPITNDGRITYNGQGKEISNVKIDVSRKGEDAIDENAGLFATLGHHSSVTNLKLVNFSVKSNGNNKAAGALAGVLDNSDVTGVLAHHDTGDTLPEANKWIDGQTSVGGLIGEITGACTVEQSAAAVYVKSSTTNGDAGGLIGKITSGSNVTVRNSYAGGHVISKDTDGNPIVATYDKVNCNVTGKNAGGLIGSSSAGTLKVLNCYATTSADGATNAGGLIGSMAGGEIKNCYATGYVKGNVNKGAFIGELNGTLNTDTNKENGYFSTVTEGLDPVGKATGVITGISPWDKESKAYGVKNAMPYDEYLQRHYTNGEHSLYTFLTISELNNGTTSPGWMTTHYGDWPPLDTLVINTSS